MRVLLRHRLVHMHEVEFEIDDTTGQVDRALAVAANERIRAVSATVNSASGP